MTSSYILKRILKNCSTHVHQNYVLNSEMLNRLILALEAMLNFSNHAI